MDKRNIDFMKGVVFMSELDYPGEALENPVKL
jgi:hypothetical protein